ncbi:hypothetical protein BD769DRAFT_1394397 [Suillus cothurnatus]|nr:hypothetical protein BD769DRAFT_1394397 [Suillus cothurnatus]
MVGGGGLPCDMLLCEGNSMGNPWVFHAVPAPIPVQNYTCVVGYGYRYKSMGIQVYHGNRVEEGVTWANPIFLSYQVQLQPSSPAWLLVSLPSRPTWIIVLPACKALSSSLLMTEARHDVAEVGVTIERPAVVLPWSGSKLWFEPDQWSGFSNAHGGDWLFDLSSNKKSNPHQDAKDIVFYNDPDDTIPLCAQSSSESAQPPLCTTSAKSAPIDAFSVLLRAGCKLAPLTMRMSKMQSPETHCQRVSVVLMFALSSFTMTKSGDAGEPESKYTFWGGISTLHTHICCSRQSTLDSNLIPKLPIFSKAGLLKYIMELIITEDEALQLVDKPAFHRLLSYVCPALVEGDIPHHTKLTESIKAHTLTVVDVICEHLAKVDSQVSMTFDSWTSMIGDPFFSITGHYIWSLDDKPQQWELCFLPTPQAALMRKIRQAVDDGNDAELNTLTQELASMEVDNDDHDGTSFDAGDSLGKALTLIEQSPQARAFFQKACQEENVPQLELLQWVRTHWALLYKCLDHMLILCCAVNHFTNLVDKSKELPTLHNKSYDDFKLDWAD